MSDEEARAPRARLVGRARGGRQSRARCRGRGAGRRRCAADATRADGSPHDVDDEQSVSHRRALADAARRHDVGRRDRDHPRQHGRRLDDVSLGAADQLHRRVGHDHEELRPRAARAGTRLLHGSRRQPLGRRQRAVRRGSGDEGPRLSAAQAHAGRRVVVQPGPSGRLACRYRHVHRSDRVRRRSERRHPRRRRPLAAPGERAAGRRSHRAAETGRHVRARRRQPRRRPGSVHGPARAGVRLARPAVRRRPLEQPRAGARRELRVRRRVAALRPAERRGDPQGRHVDRRRLGIHELHRRPARRRPRAAGACCATRAGKPAFASAARSTARCVSSYRARGPKGWPATSSATSSPGSRGAATRARPAAVCKNG